MPGRSGDGVALGVGDTGDALTPGHELRGAQHAGAGAG